jgi:hypothetical protein
MSKRAQFGRTAPITALTLLAASLVAACGGVAPTTQGVSPPAAASPSSATPSPTAPASLPADAIAHPTGPNDVVLRAGTRGGFVRLQTVMSRVPEFTLYGDGRALVLPPDGDAADDDLPALRETRLSEDEVQALLAYALLEGGLGTARDAYMGGNMDAPSTVFDLHADGADRSILVTGLTDDPAPGPDAAAMRAFADLVAKLRSIPTDADYASDRTIAFIAETEGAQGPVEAWPWTDLAPADFAQPADDAAIPFPSHILDPEQVEAAASLAGGQPALVGVKGPDGRTYSLLLRPALPDEVPGG